MNLKKSLYSSMTTKLAYFCLAKEKWRHRVYGYDTIAILRV